MVETFHHQIEGPPDPHALYDAIEAQIQAHHPTNVVLGEGENRIILAEAQIRRKCGNCTLCCTVAGVQELEKPPFIRCKHLRSNGCGCGIYPDRPKACRSFACGWLQGNFDERFRPDKIGAYFASFMQKEAGVFAVVQVDSRLENKKRVRQMVQRLARMLPEVRVIWDDQRGIIFRQGQEPQPIRLVRRAAGDHETMVFMVEELPPTLPSTVLRVPEDLG